MPTRRIIFRIILSLFLALAGTSLAHAITPGDLSIEVATTRDGIARQCETVTVKTAIQNLKSRFSGEYIKQLWSDFLETQRVMLTQRAICKFMSFMSSPGAGSPGSESCSTDMGGAAASALKQTALQKIEDTFLANCTGRATLDSAFELSRRVLNENGRDGGAAYVQDWQQFMADSKYRGLQIARNDFANTKYCPWIQIDMQSFFNFDPTTAVGDAGSADGLPRYQDIAGCQFPDGFDPTAPENQTLEVLAGLTTYEHMMPSAYLLAEANLAQQTAATQLADYTEYAYTGGVGSLREINPQTGDSCVVRLADGTCKEYGRSTQPAAGTQAELQAQRQASYAWITNARDSNQLMGDVRGQLISSLLSISEKAFTFEYGTSNPTLTISPATSTPTNPPIGTLPPGSTDSRRCFDVRTDTYSQTIAQNLVLQGTQAALAVHQGILTSSDGSTVNPGQEVAFLDAICQTTILNGLCHPRAGSSTDLVVPFGSFEMAVSVLTPSGVIRQPGQSVEICELGVF